MQKSRINYTYYNCPEVFQQIVDHYDLNYWHHYADFTVIDDGSEVSVYEAVDVPDYWRILRIDEDLGWNNEGARNCLMRDTQNKWNMLMDCDWVLTDEGVRKLAIAVEEEMLEDNTVYFHSNVEPSTFRNTFLVSKQEFWDRGGYDQCFIGFHGVDYSFLRFGLTYNHAFWLDTKRICDDVVPPESKNRAAEIERFHTHMDKLEEQGFGYRNPEDRQDFIWTSESERSIRYQEIDYRVINR